jgi:hypothetical protein
MTFPTFSGAFTKLAKSGTRKSEIQLANTWLIEESALAVKSGDAFG